MNDEQAPLRSIYKRMRNAPKRSKKKVAQKNEIGLKERHVHKKKSCDILANPFSSDKIKELIQRERECDWMRQIAHVQEKMKNTLRTYLSDENMKNDEWRKNLTDIDVYYIHLGHSPLETVKSSVLQLPQILDKLYDISSIDMMPANYRRDHLWLTLQWEIDQVDNPFLARPCESTSCLGLYIQSCGQEEETDSVRPLPELTPLPTLDLYREKRRKGMTTEDFKMILKKRKEEGEDVSGCCVWSQPKCALCRMQDIFTFAMSPLQKKGVISKQEYSTKYGIQFTGMLPQFTVNNKDAKFSLCISETNIAAPCLDIPLIGMILNALRRKGKEVVVEGLY